MRVKDLLIRLLKENRKLQKNIKNQQDQIDDLNERIRQLESKHTLYGGVHSIDDYFKKPSNIKSIKLTNEEKTEDFKNHLFDKTEIIENPQLYGFKNCTKIESEPKNNTEDLFDNVIKLEFQGNDDCGEYVNTVKDLLEMGNKQEKKPIMWDMLFGDNRGDKNDG